MLRSSPLYTETPMSNFLKKNPTWKDLTVLGQLPPPPNCPRGNLSPLPPTPKLTLTQTLTLTRGQFSTMAIVWLPPTLKLTLTLTQTPIPNRGAIFLGGNCPDTGFNIGRIEIAYNRYFDL